MARPIQSIAPFKGKAARWLRDYIETTKPDPKKAASQAQKDTEMAQKIKELSR